MAAGLVLRAAGRGLRRLAEKTARLEGILITSFKTSSPLPSFNVCLYRGEAIGGDRMLEVSRTSQEALAVMQPSPGGLGAEAEERQLREKAAKLCRDYLRGAWLTLQPSAIVLKKVSGGLSNLLYYCSLPEDTEPTSGEPGRVLLRLYGNASEERAMETLITESVIFTLLSESQRGPRLYGVFPGGRIEEYIEARALRTDELPIAQVSKVIADKLAQIHLMDVPINKQPTLMWRTMEKWLKQISDLLAHGSYHEKSRDMLKTIEELNLYEEYIWLKDYLSKVKSPVVFCHNDLQEGNILLKRQRLTENQEKSRCTQGPDSPHEEVNYESVTSESLVIIDFEYCSYNYRGFDFANHFCEWVFDYSNQEPPYFWELESNTPQMEHKRHFIENYLRSLRRFPEYKPRPEDTVDCLLAEIEAFTLASHFFWALWSVVNSTCSAITFDYWGYGEARFQCYYRHKKSILNQTEPSEPMAQDDSP